MEIHWNKERRKERKEEGRGVKKEGWVEEGMISMTGIPCSPCLGSEHGWEGGNSHWLRFSWRKTRQAIQRSFVWGLTSVDVYFWKLRKWKFISPPALPVWIWQAWISSLPFLLQMALKWAACVVQYSSLGLGEHNPKQRQPVITQRANRGRPRTLSKIRWRSPQQALLEW